MKQLLFFSLSLCTIFSCQKKSEYTIISEPDPLQDSLQNTGTDTATILTFGDSIIFGVYIKNEYQDSILAILQKSYPLKKFKLLNQGVGGETSYQSLQRIDSILAKKPYPDYVFYAIGINDIRKVIKEDTAKIKITIGNIEQLINKAQAIKTQVIVSNVLPASNIGIDTQLYESLNKMVALTNQQLQQLCLSKKVAYINSTYNLMLGKNNYYYDYLHPNGKGYRIMAEEFAKKAI